MYGHMQAYQDVLAYDHASVQAIYIYIILARRHCLCAILSNSFYLSWSRAIVSNLETMASAASSSEAVGSSADSACSERAQEHDEFVTEFLDKFLELETDAERKRAHKEAHKRKAMQVWEAAKQQIGSEAQWHLCQVKTMGEFLAGARLDDKHYGWTEEEANKWAETFTRNVWSLMGFEMHRLRDSSANMKYSWKRSSVEKPLDFNKPRKEIVQLVRKFLMDITRLMSPSLQISDETMRKTDQVMAFWQELWQRPGHSEDGQPENKRQRID